MARLGMFPLVVVFASACLERELEEVPPEVQSGPRFEIVQGGENDVDLLVLVDNSGSMGEEQDNLTANMPALIEALTTPGDADGDGKPDPAVDTLHIGVISTDMGTSGVPVATCDDAERGDDGVLQNLPNSRVVGCDATYPPFLSFDADSPDANIGTDFECIAKLGMDGCGMEQQLAAVERAITVHAAPGAPNDEFLREDALLAIVMVTDEEDCSVADPTIFEDDGRPPNLRCFHHPDMVRPVSEFVDSILSVKPGRPDRIVVAAIVGVPTDLVDLDLDELSSEDIQDEDDFTNILNDPRMQEVVDFGEAAGENLVPSCNVPGLGKAYPPRRIVELVRAMDREGNNGIVQSICQSDWGPTMRAIQRLIAGKIDRVCLPRPLEGPGGVPLESGAHAQCVVRETLTDSRDCGPGRFRIGESEGRTVCQVCQQGDGEGDYVVDAEGNELSACAGSTEHWLYTTEDEECVQVAFTDGATPEEGSEVFLQCLTTVGS